MNLDARGVLVRDSKDRRSDQPVLGISSDAWSSFLQQLR
ncbi:DUF397 domain-containing protein [Lentzea sp. HUAS12]|nr:DUF397 domain-containing protein [Lentzea sp. HUAS12]